MNIFKDCASCRERREKLEKFNAYAKERISAALEGYFNRGKPERNTNSTGKSSRDATATDRSAATTDKPVSKRSRRTKRTDEGTNTGSEQSTGSSEHTVRADGGSNAE